MAREAGDDLDIRSGGVVAVDTETLRSAAHRMTALASACGEVGAGLARAGRALERAGVWIFPPAGHAHDAADHARSLAADLQTMADIYELVEVTAQIQVADALGDEVLARELRGRANALMAGSPLVLAHFAADSLRWRSERAVALAGQYGVPGIVGYDTGALSLVFTGLVGAAGLGAVPRGTTLGGEASAVSITRTGGGRTTAPTSLAQVVDRIPGGDGRVRVERYGMPDGSRRFVAYIAGTSSGGGDEAWDWDSNLALYARQDAPSYAAVQAALADAGALSGDAVGLAGYSQGGMIASFVTLSGDYEVPLLMTFGDPVQADVGDQTLSVALRHNDDPVSALADGGFAGSVGAEGSFVASRDAPGTLLGGDGLIGPHDMDAYRETARMLDASSDPRMDTVRAQLADLARADSVDVIVYGASRVPVPVDPATCAAGEQRVSASSAADGG
jgi:hypothetical protein